MSERRALPRSFTRLTALCVAGALVAILVAALMRSEDADAFEEPTFWLLVGLTLGVELLPIRLVRPGSVDLITIASPFPLAILYLFGALPAMLTWLVVATVADLIGRLGPVKALFNAGQYTLSMGAAAAALALGSATARRWPAHGPDDPARHAPSRRSCSSWSTTCSPAPASRCSTACASCPSCARDLGFLSWTAGFQLALAPLLIGAPGALMALGAVPVLAIYLGGRQAAAAAYQATHDALTALPNQALLTTRVADAQGRRRRGDGTTSIVLVGLDRLASINTTLGHRFGDLVLCRVAERLGDVAGGRLVARVAGDTFAVLVPAAREEDARDLAVALVAGLDDPLEVEDLRLQVAASAGIAAAGPRTGPDELLQHAAVALQQARDTAAAVAVFAGEPARPALDRVALARALDEALTEGGISVHFQVKVPAGSDLPPAMEALARWRHPVLGSIDPGEFIAIAEETGMIKRLTARVLDVALARCAQVRSAGVPLRMAVNVSPKSLLDDSLPALVADALTRHGLPGQALQVEITESAAVDVEHAARTTPVVQGLRELGVTLAIDDFGTGFSSLAQLQQLPVEEIKIDRSFVLALEHDPQAEVIVRSIVTLGHSLGLHVTAEGVETSAAFERVAALGCDYTQGYLFGRPSADPSPTHSRAVA